jgi:hypothetical protein
MAVRRRPEVHLDPSLCPGDDFDLALRLLLAGASWHGIASPLVQYRIHDSNSSRSHATMRAGARAALATHAPVTLRHALARAGPRA